MSEPNNFVDQTLTCIGCREEFVFTKGEQEFFKDKGFTPPRRCPECRRRRKAEKDKENRRE